MRQTLKVQLLFIGFVFSLCLTIKPAFASPACIILNAPSKSKRQHVLYRGKREIRLYLNKEKPSENRFANVEINVVKPSTLKELSKYAGDEILAIIPKKSVRDLSVEAQKVGNSKVELKNAVLKLKFDSIKCFKWGCLAGVAIASSPILDPTITRQLGGVVAEYSPESIIKALEFIGQHEWSYSARNFLLKQDWIQPATLKIASIIFAVAGAGGSVASAIRAVTASFRGLLELPLRTVGLVHASTSDATSPEFDFPRMHKLILHIMRAYGSSDPEKIPDIKVYFTGQPDKVVDMFDQIIEREFRYFR